MEETAKIKLLRTSQAVNSGRKYKVWLNGEQETEIANGEKLVIEVKPGRHKIYLKLDWCKSKELILNLEAGAEIELICGSRLVGWKKWLTLFYLFSRDKFVYLDYYNQDMKLDYEEKTADEISEQGFVQFVLQHGIIGWGLPVAMIIFVINIFLGIEVSLYNFLVTLGLGIIGGVVFGAIMWPFLNDSK